MTIKQSPFSDQYNTLRNHYVEIAFFNAAGAIVMQKKVNIAPGSALTTVEYDGSYAVKAVLINYNDQTFCENILDPQSLLFFMANIDRITDIYTRSLVWFNIAQMARGGFIQV